MEGWIASLSNGEHYFEAPSIPGEPSSWQKLKAHCLQLGIRITMLRLVRNGTTINTLPKKQCIGYFQAYELLQSFYGEGAMQKQGIGSVVEDRVYITWMSMDGQTIWQDVRPLVESTIHII